MSRRALITLVIALSLAAAAVGVGAASSGVAAGGRQAAPAMHMAGEVVPGHLSAVVQRAQADAGRTIRATDDGAANVAVTAAVLVMAFAWALGVFDAPRRHVVLLASAAGRAPPLRPVLG